MCLLSRCSTPALGGNTLTTDVKETGASHRFGHKEDQDARTLHHPTRCWTLPSLGAAGTDTASSWPRGGLRLRPRLLSHGPNHWLPLLPRRLRLAGLSPGTGLCTCAGAYRPA